jgi:hypothetical protein
MRRLKIVVGKGSLQLLLAGKEGLEALLPYFIMFGLLAPSECHESLMKTQEVETVQGY